MKNIILKGAILAAILVFLFKGGIRLMIVGWRLFLPMLVITTLYLIVRQLMQNKKVQGKSPNENLGSSQPILICPDCNQPRGSCPKCR